MINATIILRYLEKHLGYRFNELEISSDEIIENIQDESLQTFSKYFPYVVRHNIDIVNDIVEGYKNRWYIKTDYEVNSVKKVFLANNIFGDVTQVAGYYRTHSNVVDTQFMNDLMSAVRSPVTWEFFQEDKTVEILPYHYVSGEVLVELNCVHLKDFSTIDNKLRDEFLKLCLYDTQDMLYYIRHRFSNLQTAYGSIELFIDDLQNAEDKRRELIENWRKYYFRSPKRKKIYVG